MLNNVIRFSETKLFLLFKEKTIPMSSQHTQILMPSKRGISNKEGILNEFKE